MEENASRRGGAKETTNKVYRGGFRLWRRTKWVGSGYGMIAVILNDAHTTKINVKNRMVCAFQGKGRHIEPNNHHIVTV